MSTYLDRPLFDALEAITGETPPFDLDGVYCSSELSDAVAVQLERWCCENASPFWTTGGGVLEAAELLVDRAVQNGNIPPQLPPQINRDDLKPAIDPSLGVYCWKYKGDVIAEGGKG